MSRTADVLHDIWVERRKQDIKWGGATHDDHHTMNEWRELIIGHAEREPLSCRDDRRLLIEIAALAVAAVEASDRKANKLTKAAANENKGEANDG